MLSLAAGLGMAIAVVGAPPAIAAQGHPRPGVHPVPGSGLTLAQAPAGLQAAVSKMLSRRETAHSNVFHQRNLTPAGGAAGAFGSSVAISGSTAVIGAPDSNVAPGAVYVFVHSGDAWSQQAELTADDGAENDSFGWSVAISGSTVVVGAWGKNEGAGALYVFVRSGTAWSQQAELTADDGGTDNSFGRSVAISGSTVVAGASAKDAAYVFARSGGAWSQQADLTAADSSPGGIFGSSVAISGSTAVIGAPLNTSATGAAYVFARSGGAWSQQAELTAADGSAGDVFGSGVAISGSTAVVGASGKNTDAGAAYAFVRSGTAWSQQAELTADDGAEFDQFGESVAVSGSTAAVGANFKDSGTGTVYVFARSGTAWFQQAELTAADGVSGDDFGASVAVSGPRVVAGAYAENSYAGSAYAFGLPSQQAELTAADGVSGDEAGDSVAVSGSTAVVGAPGKNSAYVFVRSGGAWSQQAELTTPDGMPGDEFGASVAVSSSTVVVGALGTNLFTGVTYVFVRSGTAWPLQAELTAPDGSSGDEFGVSVAISGSTALVGAWGKSSSSGAAYVFVRSGTTWSQQAELTAIDGSSGDNFGVSVAISGSIAVVGADGRNSGTGAAYVFSRFAREWTPESELSAPDGIALDEFGSSVGVSGRIVVAGAPGKNSGAGAAYVFTPASPGWSIQAELTATDTSSGDDFGVSVAISGSTAVVGADGRFFGTGTAYMFTRSSGAWSQQAELAAAKDTRTSYFGSSVALSGTTAVIGAPDKNSQTGAASVFVNM